MEKLLYTTDEAAEVLAISQRQVFHLLSKAEIESILIGRSRRIPRQALEQYVERVRAQFREEVA